MLSWIAALALLLHAGAAAASIWCTMAGSLVAGCACSSEEIAPDALRWEEAPGSCCNELVRAQEVELGSYEPSLAGPVAVLAWEPLPAPQPWVEKRLADAVTPATPPPLEQLATIVIVR